jgi:hypothetical protein
MFVKELRLRVEHYFQIVVRTLRVKLLTNIGNSSKEHWKLLSSRITRIITIFTIQRAPKERINNKWIMRTTINNSTKRNSSKNFGYT